MAKPYHQIPIVECGEPLIPIPDRLARVTPHPYLSLGADYAGRSPYMLRSSAVSALLKAEAHLQADYPEYRLLVFDAYRPLAVQRFMVDYTFNQLLQGRGWNLTAISPEQKQELEQIVSTFWAVPSNDPRTPPPHSTGSALDLTLITAAGELLDMGSPIDEPSPRSYPDHFQHINPQAHQNRQILASAMHSAGWVRHPQEWWHFSYRDQMWAWLSGANLADYGRVAE